MTSQLRDDPPADPRMAQDMVMRAAMPEVYLRTVGDLKGFADRVCSPR